MKKNKALTAALSVFALTMMSMCAIGGTFAKYVTTDDAIDTARVAKWGVQLSFTTYKVAEEIDVNDAQDTEISASAVEDVIIVAPGSKGKLIKSVVSGTPEVAVVIDHQVEFTITESEWTILGNNPDTVEVETNFFYCPIEITNGTNTVKGLEFKGKYSAFVDAVNGLSKLNAERDAGSGVSDTFTLSYKWVLSNGSEYDVFDTALGNLAANAANEEAMPSFSVKVTTTVTQKD